MEQILLSIMERIHSEMPSIQTIDEDYGQLEALDNNDDTYPLVFVLHNSYYTLLKTLKSFPDIVMEIRPHVEFVNGHKNPEYTINGLIADRKGVKSEDGIVNGFAKAIKQGCKSVVVDLDFHADNFKIFRSQKIAKNLLNRKNNFINGEIVECYIVWHDKAVMVNKDDFMFNDKEKNREHIINKIEKIKE